MNKQCIILQNKIRTYFNKVMECKIGKIIRIAVVWKIVVIWNLVQYFDSI